MAEVKGFTCDVCGGFVAHLTTNGRPPGWMHLTIAAVVPRPESAFAESPRQREEVVIRERNGFDLCGNTCLTKLAVERVLASDDDKLPVGVTYREPKPAEERRRPGRKPKVRDVPHPGDGMPPHP